MRCFILSILNVSVLVGAFFGVAVSEVFLLVNRQELYVPKTIRIEIFGVLVGCFIGLLTGIILDSSLDEQNRVALSFRIWTLFPILVFLFLCVRSAIRPVL